MSSSKVNPIALTTQKSGCEEITIFIIYILSLYIIGLIGVWNGTSNRNRSIVRNIDLEHPFVGSMDRQVLNWDYGAQSEAKNPDGYV
jgi:hypothetical protein